MSDAAADGGMLAQAVKSAADAVVDLKKDIEGMKSEIAKKSEVQTPPWMNGGSASVNVGRNPDSRPFSFARLAKGLMDKQRGDTNENCKMELDFARRCAESSGISGYAVPSSYEYVNDTKLAKEWRDISEVKGFDSDEYSFVSNRIGKDVTWRNGPSAGFLSSGPAMGEIIDMLRAKSWLSQIGSMQNIPLMPSGSYKFPRFLTSVAVAGYSEQETVSESQPTFGGLLLEAKKYSGMAEMSEEALKFIDTVAVDVMLRNEFTKEMELKISADAIVGPGGTRIKGLINYGNITTHTGTPGVNGDTLEPEDLDMLIAIMEDANVDASRIVFAMRSKLWTALKSRQDSNGLPKFTAYTQSYGGGAVSESYSGRRVITNSHGITKDRVKGTGADLTFALALSGDNLIMGSAGMVEMSMTNSHASNFANGTLSLKATGYFDLVPRHEEAVGLIDTLLEV